GTAEPHVRLGVGALRAQAVVHLLRAHVEPPHVDIGVELLEATLQQGEEIAAVRAVHYERRSSVAPASGREERECGDAGKQVRNAECGVRNGGCERPEGRWATPHSPLRTPHVYLRSASRFANSR